MPDYHSSVNAQVLGTGWETITGSFAPAGTGAPTYINKRGYTVARASAGVWTVTLDQPLLGFVSLFADLRMATGELGVHQVKIGGVSVSAKTFDIEHLFSANTSTTHPVAADVAANAANVVSFMVTVARHDAPGSGVV